MGGLLLRELTRGAAEAFAGQAASALPTAFLAALDEDTDVASIWAEVWEEGTSGGTGAARLYAGDIVPLIVRGASPGCQVLFPCGVLIQCAAMQYRAAVLALNVLQYLACDHAALGIFSSMPSMLASAT